MSLRDGRDGGGSPDLLRELSELRVERDRLRANNARLSRLLELRGEDTTPAAEQLAAPVGPGGLAAAVRTGVVETAKVIAAAASIMLCVFASFGFSGERIVSAIGIGLAAVLIDALVVRLTLVPALMTLIGKHNWFYPRWAERVTLRLSVEGLPEPRTVAEPVGAQAGT